MNPASPPPVVATLSGQMTPLTYLVGSSTAQRGTVRVGGADLATLDAAARTRLRLDRFGFGPEKRSFLWEHLS